MKKHLLPNLPVVFGFVTLSLLTSRATSAATLLLHYDVNNPTSWNGTTLSDLQSFGATLTPEDGVGGAGFAPPVYTASGATSPVVPPLGYQTRNRAYLNFIDFGILNG